MRLPQRMSRLPITRGIHRGVLDRIDVAFSPLDRLTVTFMRLWGPGQRECATLLLCSHFATSSWSSR